MTGIPFGFKIFTDNELEANNRDLGVELQEFICQVKAGKERTIIRRLIFFLFDILALLIQFGL